MKFINKKETVAKIVEGTRMARRLGFSVEGTIIFGFPAETFEDRLRGFSLAQRLGLGRVRFNNLTPYPGTRLFDMAVQEGRLSITEGWANFNSAGATASKLCSGFVLPYVPHGTTDGALQGEVLWANILSYLSIKRIFRMITPSRQPTGIGFQFTFMQFLRPARIFRLALALATVAVRAMWWFVFEK